MKHLLALALALLCGAAFATGKPPVTPPTSTASATAAAKAGATADAAATGGIAYGGSTMSGDTSLYVLPPPITGGNLPAGMCQRSKYDHGSILFGVLSRAVGDSFTDLECLGLLMRLEELKRQPLPKPAVEILTGPQRPTHAEQAAAALPPVCTPPAKAKTVAAAKAAGACKS